MTAAATDEKWPPRSARQALLSSPSGRKTVANSQAGAGQSPSRSPYGTPSLLDRLRLARNNQEQVPQPDEQEDDEDDEETLKLQLAAIEAKLKLRRLQNKARKEDETLPSRPTSVAESVPAIEVALSPAKRQADSTEQRSPSRVLLGIDKGVRGADISLRRARPVGENASKPRFRQHIDRSRQPGVNVPTPQDNGKEKVPHAMKIKSFSERMAEVRDNDRKQVDKRDGAFRARAKKFVMDAAEIEEFKATAENSVHDTQTAPSTRNAKTSLSKAEPAGRQLDPKKVVPRSDAQNQTEQQTGDASLFEGFSGLHLSTRILPHSFLKRTLPSEQFTIYRVPDLLKNITSPAYEIPDEVGDFVVFGVIASKSSPLDQKNRLEENVKTSQWDKKWDDGSQNRKKFMVMTLTDLKWSIDLYLFDTALPRYYRLTPGTVIAILNPSIMPPKKGREDTGAFSLSLHDGDDTVLEIGTSKHLGYCNAVKKDGKECGQWVNATKTQICEWHVNAQIAKTQANRMGVNTGFHGFGGNGPGTRGSGGEFARDGYRLLPTKNGRGFDRETGSHYYISSSSSKRANAPVCNPEISTVRMLDADDDPFVAEGQFSRDKEAILQKRMAKQEKERDIARRLANIGSGSGAGAEYMRRKAEDGPSQPTGKTDSRLKRRHLASVPASASGSDAHTTSHASSNLKAEIGRKRAAEDVRLSPVKKKKTRFVTDRGIKEAGRESTTGPRVAGLRFGHDIDDDDDDDLDIV